MGRFAITVTFLTGWFHAHDSRGHPEWPPMPSRLGAAILATAYRTGIGVEAARLLHSVPPPVEIQTPPAGERDVAFRRWVPVDVEVDLIRAATGRGGLSSKLSKPPERGSHVGEAELRYVIEAPDPVGLDLDELARVVEQVPYLGRPTSPVAMTMTDADDIGSEHVDVWMREDDGSEVLTVWSERWLQTLDDMELARATAGVTGYHPRKPQRPVQRYRRRRASGGSGLVGGSRRRIEDFLQETVEIAVPKAGAQDLLAVVDTLGDPEMIVPVLELEKVRQRETARMRSVLVVGQAPPAIDVLVGGEVRTLRPALPRPTPAVRHTLERVLAEATGWTTTVPVPLDPDGLRREAMLLGERSGTVVVDATLHRSPRGPLAPSVEHHPGMTHVSLLFERALTGPVVLAGNCMRAIDPSE